MIFPRASGILLHPTSLPGRFGIGDLGIEAYRFVDFLESSSQHVWQVLPLGPTGYGDSPYQCFSAFAGNPLLISPEKLIEAGLLSQQDLEPVPAFPKDRVEFGQVIEYKTGLLAKAYLNFKASDRAQASSLRSSDIGGIDQSPHAPSNSTEASPASLALEFDEFCLSAAPWLDDYAMFRALKDENGGAPWNKWSTTSPSLPTNGRVQDRARAEKFYQYLFFKQWNALKAYCSERGISIVGDMPIFVAYDSAEVWSHPELFKLDSDGRAIVVAGVPPDYFSSKGQLWGNPIYDWARMKSDGFGWWIDRVRWSLQVVDVLRVDHFRGFCAAWEIPAEDETAVGGAWIDVPGRDLFKAFKDALGDLPIIAEDLGVITPDVVALREEFGLPGMRVMQFAFSSDSENQHLPHNYVREAVVYTGTHDNDTTAGWFHSEAGKGSTRDSKQIERERDYCLRYLRSDGKEINWDMITVALESVANTAIFPMQDVLGLDSSARMNLPASKSGNWTWRLDPSALTGELAERLRDFTMVYGRDKGTV